MAKSASPAQQYLSFFVHGEEFALPILRVVEIVPYQEPSRLPNAPPVLRGVVGVRGNVVPALDLARVFGFGDTDITRRSCIVLVEMATRERPATAPMLVGVVVEKVSEVADVPLEAMLAPPEFGMPVRAAYLSGLYPARGKFVFALDLDRVLSDAELAAVAHAARHDDGAPDRHAPSSSSSSSSSISPSTSELPA
jgi:purine-binding chemotaxis protein CheW